MSVINQMLRALDARHAPPLTLSEVGAGPGSGAAVSPAPQTLGAEPALRAAAAAAATSAAVAAPRRTWPWAWRPERLHVIAAVGVLAIVLVAFADPRWFGLGSASAPQLAGTPEVAPGQGGAAVAADASQMATVAGPVASAVTAVTAAASAPLRGAAAVVASASVSTPASTPASAQAPASRWATPAARPASAGLMAAADQGDLALRAERVIFTPLQPASVAPAVGREGAQSLEKTWRTPGAAPRAAAAYRAALELAASGHSSQAVTQALAAVQVDPAHVDARQLAAVLMSETQRVEEAASLLREGLARQPGQPQLVYLLGRLLVQMGQLDEALVLMPAGAALTADAHGLRGGVLVQRSRYAEAQLSYEQAARLAPDNPAWWVGLGVALEAQGQTDLARLAYQRGRAVGSASGELGELLAQRLGGLR